MLSRMFAAAVAGTMLAMAAGPALAENPDAAVAARYAQQAAQATTIEDVHKHMRAALSCLVGLEDEDFKPEIAGECANARGAIKLADGMAAVSYRLAAQVVKTALAIDTLGGAQFAARTAERLIQATDPARPAADLVENAQHATGTVDRIDAGTRTVTLGADTYYLRDNAALIDITAGERVEVTYVVEDGRRMILDVRKIDQERRN